MGLKIRLRQQGRTNAKSYRLVLADVRSPRDGKYIETLGWYQPLQQEDKQSQVNEERIAYWIEQGAEPTEKAAALIARLAPSVNKKWREKTLAQKDKRRVSRHKESAKS